MPTATHQQHRTDRAQQPAPTGKGHAQVDEERGVDGVRRVCGRGGRVGEEERGVGAKAGAEVYEEGSESGLGVLDGRQGNGR